MKTSDFQAPGCNGKPFYGGTLCFWLLFVLTAVGGGGFATAAGADREIQTSALTARLDETGKVVECLVGEAKTAWPLELQNRLAGCREAGSVAVRKISGGFAFTRQLADDTGHTATLAEHAKIS